jgi:hypothetical protein
MGSYASDGYELLPGLVQADVAGAYLRLLKRAIDKAAQPPLEAPSPVLTKKTYEIYAQQYLPMQTFLWGLTPAIRKITGLDLVPTYAYTRIYQKGDVLRVHTDREACEHSLSLTLEYSDGLRWPLDMGRDRHEHGYPLQDTFGGLPYVSLRMNAGDAVLYKGFHHAHGRLIPNPNRWSAHMFLHWVNRKGPFADQAFDGIDLGGKIDFTFG